MAKSTARKHSAPGIYFSEEDLTHSAQSLGITTLGVVGETLKGPAFQPISISDFREFQTYFGGTSTKKYKGSQYPKYELPYIAKTYLEQSKQLEVVRVLGLSGANAGPAWVITASKYKTDTGYKYVKMNGVPSTSAIIPTLSDAQVCCYKNNDWWIEKSKAEDAADYVRVNGDLEWHAICQDEGCEFFESATVYDLGAEIPNPTSIDETMAIRVKKPYQVTAENTYTLPASLYSNPVLKITNPQDFSDVAYVYIVNADRTDAVIANYVLGANGGGQTPALADHFSFENGKVTNLDEPTGIYNGYDYEELSVEQILGLKVYDFADRPVDYYYDGRYDSVYLAYPEIIPENPEKDENDVPIIELLAYDATPDNFNCSSSSSENEWYGYTVKTTPSYYRKTFVSNAIRCLNIDCSDNCMQTVEVDEADEAAAEAYAAENCAYENSKDYCIDGDSGKDRMVVGVLRSRGEHKPRTFVRKAAEGECNDVYENDGILYYAKCVKLTPSMTMSLNDDCSPSYVTAAVDYGVNANNYGTFTLQVTTADGLEKNYAVSLNKGDKNYIYNVLGSDPETGDSEIYVEELYDVALEQMVLDGQINAIDENLIYYPAVSIVPQFADADDIVTVEAGALTKRNRGRRYLYDENARENAITVRYSADNGRTWSNEVLGEVGGIYTVRYIADPNTGKKTLAYTGFLGKDPSDYSYVEIESEECPYEPDSTYWVSCEQDFTDEPMTSFEDINDAKAICGPGSPSYVRVSDKDGGFAYYLKSVTISTTAFSTNGKFPTEIMLPYNYNRQVVSNGFVYSNCVKVLSDDMTYTLVQELGGEPHIQAITLDMNNYKDQFRYASTPWIVSEIKGSATDVELHRLFRFHTISDGNAANTEVKISLENIDPVSGTFDVLVRDYYDSDYSTNVLERYNNCSLVPGESNYIALKIGSFDEAYEMVSKYISVEVNEDDITALSTPAGFLGYPVRCFDGFGITPSQTRLSNPEFRYNTTVDEDVRIKKQYFGISDLVGIDSDIFAYKGVEAYNGLPSGMTPCFHLDARILNGTPDRDGYIVDESDPTFKQRVMVDGITGYSWVTVNKNQTTDMGIEPRIGNYEMMEDTIYEDIKYRKFTLCFFGGFDGWDYYRTSRSNSNEFSYNNYKSYVNSVSGYGKNFSILKNKEAYGFDPEDNAITSDYYAYLAGVNQLDNNKEIEINILATPGIDYVNQSDLVDDIVEIVEDERADCVYVVTTPDKPFGASDSAADMYSEEEAVDNLDESNLDTSFACTYYPWYKYYDSANNQYIYLPITRDVVRAIAYTDNVTYPWYAAAGWNRGALSGIKPKKKLKQEGQDTLYDGRINFVCSFGNEGDKIWGDKNLQIADSQLNRLSTRRLMLRIRKLLSNACIGLIFDPNDPALGKTFESAVKEVLNDVKQKRGIVDFKVEIDQSAERIEKHEIGCKYYIKVNPKLEYIDFTAVLTPQGTQF